MAVKLDYVPSHARGSVRILGLPIWNPDYDEFVSWFEATVNRPAQDRTCLLGIANAHTLNLAYRDSAFMACLEELDAIVDDGAGLALAAKMRGTAFRYNFNGTDLFPRLFSELTSPLKVFLYGASEESNLGAAREIESRFNMVQVVGRLNGFAPRVDAETILAINESGADLLLVALGQPKQEEWLLRNSADLNVALACGVGALFDFLSGRVSRAPRALRNLRLEWLYRLMREPRRMFTRYVIGNPVFILRTIIWRRRDMMATDT